MALPLNADVGCVIFDGQTTGFKKWKLADLKNRAIQAYAYAKANAAAPQFLMGRDWLGS